MNSRWFGVWSSALVAVLLLPVAASGQDAASNGSAVPLTSWGDPALQGVWTGSTLTPLERPAELAGKTHLTEEEVATRERGVDETRFVERAPREGDPGTYNQVWFDPGTRIVPDRRTALIVDPPDGRIPYTPEMTERHRLQVAYRVNGARKSWIGSVATLKVVTEAVSVSRSHAATSNSLLMN